jgi:iron complex outermembrane receptor protein
MDESTKKVCALACALAGATGAPPVFAGEITGGGSSTETLSSVDVVGSPIIEANAVDGFASLSTVVTDAQVRDLNALDLSSALRRTPGVTISRFNPVGSFGGEEGGSVNIRGMGASRPGSEIKTYIDGIPLYMGVWNHPLLDLIPINGMERITVYKGPQPQLFGNTFGAIDLTPKQSSEPGLAANGRIAGGSFATFVEQADVVGSTGTFDYTLAQGYARSDGHRDDGDGELVNVLGRGAWHINPQWTLGTMVLFTDNSVSDPGQEGLPATRQGLYETQATLAALFLDHDHGIAHGSLKVYGNTGEGNLLDQPGLDGDTLSSFDMYGIRWKESLTPWAGGEIAGGVDVDAISGDVDFNRIAPAPQAVFNGPTLTITSPHVALNHRFDLGGGWSMTPSVGVRGYVHNELEDELAPHGGVVFNSELIDVRANVARGFNYPGLDAAVLSSLITALGDSWKSLAPEQMDHVEFGVTFRPWQRTTMDLAVFRDFMKDRYIFAFPPRVTAPSFVNLGDYQLTGIEATLQQDITDHWNLFAGLTILDASRENLPYVPEESLVLGTTAEFGSWRFSADVLYQNEMFVLNRSRADGALNTSKVDSFIVVNARAAYAIPAFGPRGEVFVAIENLLDRDYEYRSGYPMPGVSAQVGLNVSY